VTALATVIGHATAPCSLRTPCRRLPCPQLPPWPPHGGILGSHGVGPAVGPVGPVAPQSAPHRPEPEPAATHGIGRQSEPPEPHCALSIGHGVGGGGHDVVEPVAPVLPPPDQALLICTHGGQSPEPPPD